MLNFDFFESALLFLSAALLTAFCVLVWWKAVGGRVKELLGEWRRLPVLWKVILPLVFGAFCLHGSTKNGNVANVQVLPVAKSNYQSGNGENPSNLVNPVNPVQKNFIASSTVRQNKGRKQTTRTDLYVRSWNTTGVWEESFWFEFENDFVFPFGTNHLKGVELHSWGEIWSTHRKDAVLAELGEKVAIGRGVSRFEWEYIAASETNESKYVYSWYNGLVNRETNSVINGRIELMRSGDILVATNGVERIIPRELSFEHDGFGQDNEWVRANFTNANEILSVGYAQWVNDQVGVDLTNGLYKLIVTVPEKPLEITELNVGGYSVAITNAGEYVFLLEKGVEYPLSVFPETATNFIYSAVDDVSNMYSRQAFNGYWTRDHGRLELVVPISPLSFIFPRIRWNPELYVTPETWQPTKNDPSETFTAVLVDCPSWITPEYHWDTSDSTKVRIASPNSQTTEITCVYPQINEEGSVTLSLEVFLNKEYLYSYFYVNDDPEWNGGSWDSSDFSFRIEMPRTLFINNDDDNGNGMYDWDEKNASMDDDNISAWLSLESSNEAYGKITIDGIYGLSNPFANFSGLYEDTAQTPDIEDGASYDVDGLWRFSKAVKINPSTLSESYLGSEIRLRWTPKSGPERIGLARFSVVEPIVEPICNQTTNVIIDGVERKLTVNPCGVAIGENAYFRIEVNPSDYPDDKIVWEAKGAGIIEFSNGNKGRNITIRGLEKGKTELQIQIGDSKSDKPTFTVNVVEKRIVDVRAWIVTDVLGNKTVNETNVIEMIKEANDIYAQVGVRFNLVEPITVTNLPSAYKAYYNYNQAQDGRWTFDQIVDIASNTGGIECYFIDSFIDKGRVVGVNNGYGMVLTSRADAEIFAHECGHLFGMSDVYIDYENECEHEVMLYEMASYEKMPADWSGGCTGKGYSGTRYYKYATSMQSIINRMLMNGIDKDGAHDITAGDVYGVWYYYGDEGEKVWGKSLAPVGWKFDIKDESFNFSHK